MSKIPLQELEGGTKPKCSRFKIERVVREKSAFVKELRTLCNALLADLLESLLLVDSSSTVAVENICVIKNHSPQK